MGLLRRSRSGKAARLAAPREAKAGKRRRGLRRLPWEIRLIWRASIYLGIPIGALLACAFVIFTVAIPDPIQLRRRDSAPLVRVLAQDGRLLASRGGRSVWRPVRLLL